MINPKRIVISNGAYKFHMAPLAAELAARGVLTGFITAGWPNGWQRTIAKKCVKSASSRRFLDRWEPVPQRLVYSNFLSEAVLKCAQLVRRYSLRASQLIDCEALRIYASRATQIVSRLKPDIYHYRCCYGRESVMRAHELGAVCICDHSIAHPRLLEYLVDNEGAFPRSGGLEPKLPLNKLMESDLRQATHVLVNSEFVKRTCVHAGMPEGQVHVIYLGVDDKFLSEVPDIRAEDKIRGVANTLLYAGGWQVRKGARILIRSLRGVEVPWNLEVAGGIESALLKDSESQQFFREERVRHLGILSRSELARKMAEHRVFVFPSFCEGSARVVFEALACGCYVITTPSTGSIVEDGVHGKLVPPGDTDALTQAISWALQNPETVAEIGEKNAALVRARYRQVDYGDNVLALYEKLLSRR